MLNDNSSLAGGKTLSVIKIELKNALKNYFIDAPCPVNNYMSIDREGQHHGISEVSMDNLKIFEALANACYLSLNSNR
jgi:hypothetical protein